MTSLVKQFTFFAGCLARTPFRAQVAAAAKAGFDSMSCWPNIWRHAQQKEGLTLADMRAMLDDHGLAMTDLDPYPGWTPAPVGPDAPFAASRHAIPLQEFLDVGQRLGATTIVAVHVSNVPLNLDRETEAFARTCDRAADCGLRVGLEFVAFGGVPDVATAMKIVEGSGRANAGYIVDLWHHSRSTNDNQALERLPADKVYTVQISEGPAVAPPDIVDEATFHRQWPGDGEFDVTGFLQLLQGMGAQAAVGAELYQPSFQEADTDLVVARIAEASRAALRAAGIVLPSWAEAR